MAAPFTNRPKNLNLDAFGYVFGFDIISSTVKRWVKNFNISFFYKFEIMCCGYKWVEIIVYETSTLGTPARIISISRLKY